MDIKNKFKIYLLDEGAVYMMVGDLVGEVTRLGVGGGGGGGGGGGNPPVHITSHFNFNTFT